MNYWTLFEGKTLFNKLWPLFNLRAESDLRMTKLFKKNVLGHLKCVELK